MESGAQSHRDVLWNLCQTELRLKFCMHKSCSRTISNKAKYFCICRNGLSFGTNEDARSMLLGEWKTKYLKSPIMEKVTGEQQDHNFKKDHNNFSFIGPFFSVSYQPASSGSVKTQGKESNSLTFKSHKLLLGEFKGKINTLHLTMNMLLASSYTSRHHQSTTCLTTLAWLTCTANTWAKRHCMRRLQAACPAHIHLNCMFPGSVQNWLAATCKEL